ncbi:MAG: phosphate/phosphite/phosphonate ABC transporter substrate-binding protein [Wenzhouxiangella sp.]|nr:MAG: phosphate/phosphite/phosphonate ABC transporter substrate-binding protein [Wenzhouxiangella sp.]
MAGWKRLGRCCSSPVWSRPSTWPGWPAFSLALPCWRPQPRRRICACTGAWLATVTRVRCCRPGSPSKRCWRISVPLRPSTGRFCRWVTSTRILAVPWRQWPDTWGCNRMPTCCRPWIGPASNLATVRRATGSTTVSRVECCHDPVTPFAHNSGTIAFLSNQPRVIPTFRSVALLALAFLLASCCPQEQLDERGWPKQLVLGLVPALEAEALVDNLDPLTDHLEQALGIPVRSFVPQDYTGLVEALGSGRADIGMLPPFAAMLGERRYDIESILVSTRRGETGYRPQWMTHDRSVCETEIRYEERLCDSRVRGRESVTRRFAYCQGDLERMRGQSVAFVDPNSTSGFLFPAVQLRELGIDHQRDLNSLFVGGHDAVALAVYSEDTLFGVSYDDVRNMICGQYPDIGEKVIVFENAPMIPNDGVQLRPGMPDDLRQAIKDAFIDLAESQADLPDDEKVLWVLYEIDGFIETPEGVYEPVRAAYELMRN